MSVSIARPLCGAENPLCQEGVPLHEYDEAYRVFLENIAVKSHQIDVLKARIGEKHPNLIDIHDDLTRVGAELEGLLTGVKEFPWNTAEKKDCMERIGVLQNAVKGVGTRLVSEPLRELFKEQKKWVDAGFDRRLVRTDPEAVHFAVSSKLIYTISMFEKSADILKGEPLTIRNDDGVALFKVEGEWVPYANFKNKIQYSEKECRFVGWNFIHPQGFIPRDWAEYGQIYPIATITPEAYQKIKAHAEQFWSKDQPEVDHGIEKGYILQVMTTGRDLLPNVWWAQNFKEHFPEHGSARLITPEGLVYSFGTKMRLPDEEVLCHVSSYLCTGISNVPTPDYEESRKADDRLMASLPVTKERFDSIIDFVNRANQGICFNFSRQNCVRFVEVLLRLSGMKVSIKTSVHELLRDMLPRLSDIPIIGKQLSAASTRIACVVASVFDTIGMVLGYVTPHPIKKIVEFAAGCVTNVLQRIEAVFWNGLGLILGASKSIVPESRANDGNLKEVETFRQLIHWSDLFTPGAVSIYYVTKLKEWMVQQRNTVLFIKPEHGFCCFDPADKAAFHSPVRLPRSGCV
jgi:hypothetical protein